MTRISTYLLVQRVETALVIMDESSGEEVVVPFEQIVPMMAAVVSLFPDASKPSGPPDSFYDGRDPSA